MYCPLKLNSFSLLPPLSVTKPTHGVARERTSQRGVATAAMEVVLGTVSRHEIASVRYRSSFRGGWLIS
jgi:hypothetical protein